MPRATKKQEVKVETHNEKVLNFGKGQYDNEDRLIRLRNESGKLVVTAPCGEERELNEEQADLVFSILDVLTDVIDNNDVLMEVYNAFDEVKSEIF